jgi:hypothetical protein
VRTRAAISFGVVVGVFMDGPHATTCAQGDGGYWLLADY